MIGIIDCGMGNLLSVYHALEFMGADAKIITDPVGLTCVDRVILPGVGAFGDYMNTLRQRGFVESLEKAVIKEGLPILGICLGMQVMARRSFEGGEHRGLGWIAGDVIRIKADDPGLRVPHIGWNDVQYSGENFLFNGLPEICDFYFVHSYYLNCDDQNDIVATCDYGGMITAAVRKNNIFATQFHPEKSQDYGLHVLGNFLKWNP